MRASNLTSCLALAAAAVAVPLTPRSPPEAPLTEYLFTVTIKSGAPIELGETPAGQRAFQTISGGTFSGPELQGTVIGGLDSGFTDGNGNFNPDVVYLLHTSDGCDVLAREKGHAPNVFILFETACDQYDWLNEVVTYGMAARVADGIAVDVWKMSREHGV